MARQVLAGEWPRTAKFDQPLLGDMLRYGLPMIAFELAGIVLFLGDRFVIDALLGPGPLGLYVAAYSLCGIASTLLVESLQRAFLPALMQRWTDAGVTGAQALVSRMLCDYLMAACGVWVFYSVVGADLLALLASEKYRSAAPVLPWVMAGVLVGGLVPYFSAGLHLEKRGSALSALLVAGAVVNLGLNALLIPRLGLVGAALATFVANLVMALAALWLGRATLRLQVSWSQLFRALAPALAAALLLAAWPVASVGGGTAPWWKLGAAALCFACVAALTHPEVGQRLRQLLRQSLPQLLRRASGGRVAPQEPQAPEG
jgi:O-antigen/teichoic acid export membrane protein